MMPVPQLLFFWCLECGFENCDFEGEAPSCGWCENTDQFVPFGHQPATYAALAAYCRRVAEAVYREVEEQCAELLEKYRGQRQAEEAVAALRQRAAGTRQRLHERARQMERRG